MNARPTVTLEVDLSATRRLDRGQHLRMMNVRNSGHERVTIYIVTETEGGDFVETVIVDPSINDIRIQEDAP